MTLSIEDVESLVRTVDPRDTRKAALAVGLQYVSDSAPGIARKGKPGRFRYLRPDGRAVRDRTILTRIRALAIPPAWQDVWIAPSPDSHIQATGRDARGRKQYRYHPEFAAVRDGVKYAHLAEFAAALPALRKRLRSDLARPGLCRERILAAVVSLLEQTLIRVGNEDYARSNHSFGLTTLRNRHVKVVGGEVRFLFKGKSGKEWSLSLRDRRVAKIVRSCQELPGQQLFEYRDESGAIRSVSSSDVNSYLREISGRDITAKDFRTWAGTVKAATGFNGQQGPFTKKLARDVVTAVSEQLGNTVAVCRRCYIHPAIFEDVERGLFSLRIPARGKNNMTAEEAAVLSWLRRRSRNGAAKARRA